MFTSGGTNFDPLNFAYSNQSSTAPPQSEDGLL